LAIADFSIGNRKSAIGNDWTWLGYRKQEKHPAVGLCFRKRARCFSLLENFPPENLKNFQHKLSAFVSLAFDRRRQCARSTWQGSFVRTLLLSGAQSKPGTRAIQRWLLQKESKR